MTTTATTAICSATSPDPSDSLSDCFLPQSESPSHACMFLCEGGREAGFFSTNISRAAVAAARRRRRHGGERGQPPHAAVTRSLPPLLSHSLSHSRRWRSLSISVPPRQHRRRGGEHERASEEAAAAVSFLSLVHHPSGRPSVRPLSSIQFPSFLTESLNNNPPLSPSLALKLLHTRSRAPFHLRPTATGLPFWFGPAPPPACDSLRSAGKENGRVRALALLARLLVGFRGVLFRWSMMSMWTESDWVRSLALPPSCEHASRSMWCFSPFSCCYRFRRRRWRDWRGCLAI